MKAALREEEITLTMRRYPSVFQLKLTKSEAFPRLGLKFERPSPQNPNADQILYLRVTEVSPGGLIEESNRRNVAAGLPQFAVIPGMLIEAVNDAKGNADALAEELRQCSTVSLRLR